MSLDLNSPDAWPAYRPLLHDLAELWLPLETPLKPPPEPAITSLQVQVDDLRARMARLEQAHTTPPAPPRPSTPPPPKALKPPYVDVPQATVDARWNAWIAVPMRDPRYSGLPPSVAQDQFARHNGLSVREFRRWFSAHRTHTPGGPQDVKYRTRISEALDRLSKP